MSSKLKQCPPGLLTRNLAITILNQVLSSRHGLENIMAASKTYNQMEGRDRAFIRLLVAATIRRLGQIDALIRGYLKRPIPKKAHAVQDILRIGAAQIILLETPAHAVVNTAVRLCEQTRNPGQKGLVNAILRKISQEGSEKFFALDSAKLNTPKWLWDSWQTQYGEKTCRAIGEAHLKEPPLSLSTKGDPEELSRVLGGELTPTGSIILRSRGMVDTLAGYDDGTWWIQDTAAALPAKILIAAMPNNQKHRFLDMCAAPGGKTAQLAASGATVTAIDRSKKRLNTLRANLTRLKLKATIIAADASAYRPSNTIDGILIDAPCTATGTIRRHPDIARNKRYNDVQRLSQIQKQILENAIDHLLPGSVLVYSVCSLQHEEGGGLIQEVLAKNDQIKRLPIDPVEFGLPINLQTESGDIQTLPCHLNEHGGMDGFFIARLHRPS